MKTRTRTKRTVTPRGTKRVVKVESKRIPARGKRRRGNLVKLAVAKRIVERRREAA